MSLFTPVQYSVRSLTPSPTHVVRYQWAFSALYILHCSQNDRDVLSFYCGGSNLTGVQCRIVAVLWPTVLLSESSVPECLMCLSHILTWARATLPLFVYSEKRKRIMAVWPSLYCMKYLTHVQLSHVLSHVPAWILKHRDILHAHSLRWYWQQGYYCMRHTGIDIINCFI